MDNTKVPRPLIYRERRSLEEFIDNSSLNETLVDNMSNLYYMRKHFKERALKCMNTAYYICTLMLREKHPEWSFDTYCDLAFCEDKDNNFYQAVTLSLVSVYINGLCEDQRQKLKKLKKQLDDYMNSILHFTQLGDPLLKDCYYADILKIIKSCLTSYSIDENEFAFRVIDKEAVRDVIAERHFNWITYLDFFRESRVREFVDYYGSTEDEKHCVVDILRQAANSFYSAGYAEKIDPAHKMLDDIDNEIHLRYLHKAEKETIGDTNNTNAQQETQIKQLEAEICSLKEEFQQAQLFIEDITQEVEELTAEEKVRMALALELLRAAGLNDKTLYIRGNKVKAATIMMLLTGISSNNSRGNKAQICQTFLSDNARYFPRKENMDTLIKLNHLFVDLGLTISLSIESQSNKKA